jgi:hypothetical protein
MVTQNAINLSAAGVVSYNGTGTFTGSVLTQFDVLVGGAANAISSVSPGIAGLVLTSNGVSANPTFQAAVTGAFPYTVVTGATQTMVSDNGYIANAATGGVAFTLPATSSVGDILIVDGRSTGSGWTIAYGAGQSIQVGNTSSTVATGTLASTNNGDCVRMVCAVANATWIVESSMGNITVT